METGIQFDKNELKQIVQSLDQLFPDSDTKLRMQLRTAMRKAAVPIRSAIRTNIDSALLSLSKWKNLRGKRASEAQTGQMKKSIAIINGKVSRGRKPSVYIGPRVKGAWAAESKTGFYFYFLEYGKAGAPARRMLDKAAKAKGGQAMNDVVNQLKTLLEKRWAKKLG